MPQTTSTPSSKNKVTASKFYSAFQSRVDQSEYSLHRCLDPPTTQYHINFYYHFHLKREASVCIIGVIYLVTILSNFCKHRAKTLKAHHKAWK